MFSLSTIALCRLAQFAAMSIALHIPITRALIGIVLRGAAFSFRAYGLQSEARRTSLGQIFAGASVLTPFCLGMSLAAISTGAVRVSGVEVTSGFFAGWLTPFFRIRCSGCWARRRCADYPHSPRERGMTFRGTIEV